MSINKSKLLKISVRKIIPSKSIVDKENIVKKEISQILHNNFQQIVDDIYEIGLLKTEYEHLAIVEVEITIKPI